jgi:phosphoenolpyruvate carboxykinase (ATP)
MRRARGRAGHQKNVVMLAADAFGVFRRCQADAAQRCITSCPATPRRWRVRRGLGKGRSRILDLLRLAVPAADPSVYGNLLRDLIAKHVSIAGWSIPAGPGGKYGTGRAHGRSR